MWIFFRSTLFRHNCIVAWIIIFLGATRTVHTCLTAALQAILSFLVSLFTSYDPQSHKISQLYCFQILPSIKVNRGMAPCPLRVCHPWKVYNVLAKKLQKSYVWLHSRLIKCLKENWLVLPKTVMRNLANFHQSTLKSLNWDLNGILLSKV